MTITFTPRSIANFPALRADVTIRTTEGFVLRGLQILEGQRGLFVSSPSRKYAGAQGEQHYRFILIPEEKREEIVALWEKFRSEQEAALLK